MLKEKITAEQQYKDLKLKYPNCILLFRMGDFYELFDDDAVEISKAIGLTLTSRDKGEVKRPMAGIPHHAFSQYIGKIVKLGYKVAVAEQMEDPKTTKGIVKRDVVKVISASNLVDEKNLSHDQLLSTVSIVSYKNKSGTKNFGISWIDLSTGDFYIKELSIHNENLSVLLNFLMKLNPSEIVCNRDLHLMLKNKFNCSFFVANDYDFDITRAYKYICEYFGVSSLKGFGIDENEYSVISAAMVLKYLLNLEKIKLLHINKISKEKDDFYMDLDFSSIRNLELLHSLNIRNTNDENSLISVLDKTRTPMGKRTIRKWIIRPLIKFESISDRLEIVDSFTKFISKNSLQNKISESLKNIYDIERFAGRIGMQNISPKDLIALSSSLKSFYNLDIELNNISNIKDSSLFKEIDSSRNEIFEIVKLIDESILPNPSNEIHEGEIFVDKYNNEIQELRHLKKNGNDWLLNYQKEQVEATKISTLKVKFNNVFGYFIEISNSYKNLVPNNYIRKQTLVNGERYITEELKEMEDKILNSSGRLFELEKRLFLEFRILITKYIRVLQKISVAIGALDTLYSFAESSVINNYVKPNILKTGNPKLVIKNLRHPVVESVLSEKYIPNDVDLSEDRFVLLTGPNMSGKSTYIRSVAILVIMAQCGCFVPATECILSITDKVYTRIGSSDNISTGESTFMVEMNEAANILNNCTINSLVILDEIGRGTSTYDGLAIAYSIVKYLLKIGSRSFFATHYHELTKLEGKYNGITNFSVKVHESNDEVLFTHKIVKGPSEKSFGIHVAKLAGVPIEVIKDAEKILQEFENQNKNRISNKSKQSGDLELYDNSLFQ